MHIIGIAGGSGSGKTTVVRKIQAQFPGNEVVVLSQDAYYRDNSHLPIEARQATNYDHPDSIEFELLIQHLHCLRQHQVVQQPQYSFITCTRESNSVSVAPAPVVVLEGILIFTQPELRQLIDLKIFVDAEADNRLMRIIKRDLHKRGRSFEQVMERYVQTVQPMHQQFIEPCKQYADLIIPHGGKNEVAVDLLIKYIQQIVREER